MKKIWLILSAALSLTACDNNNLEEMLDGTLPGNDMEGVVMTIPEFEFEDAVTTRTTMTDTESGMTFVWNESDRVNVASKSGSTISKGTFKIGSVGNNAKIATFTGDGFELSANTAYYAFYPYSSATTNPTMTLNYASQTQSANASYAHLNAIDYMIANATTDAEANAVFNFNHLGAILKFKITVPATETFTKATFTSTGNTFTTKGSINYTSATTITSTTKSSDLVVSLSNIKVNAGEVLTVYAFTAPVNLSGASINIKLTAASGLEYLGSVTGNNIEKGKAYGYNASVEEPTPYVTFSSTDNTQTFTLTKSGTDTSLDGKFQYSVNGTGWNTLTFGQAISFGGNKGDLRLRSKSSNGTGGNLIVSFSKSTPVACSGDIRTLVDYENYETTDCSHATFGSLFSGCSQLTSAPELPITTLADMSYHRMFKGCTSLATAPALPAQTLASMCYYEMFNGCTSLVNVPALLPANTLFNYSYYSMFAGCTSLKTAPNIATITALNDNNANDIFGGMFSGCTALTKAPDELKLQLTQFTLGDHTFGSMFINCSSLTTAPTITVVNLGDEFMFDNMFSGCSKLNYVKVMYEYLFGYGDTTSNWLKDVASTGTFVLSSTCRYYDPDTFVYGPSTVPEGWTIKFESPAGILNNMEGNENW